MSGHAVTPLHAAASYEHFGRDAQITTLCAGAFWPSIYCAVRNMLSVITTEMVRTSTVSALGLLLYVLHAIPLRVEIGSDVNVGGKLRPRSNFCSGGKPTDLE